MSGPGTDQPETRDEYSPVSLSLGETLRIMDVASALRRQREQAQQQLAADEMRSQLRRKVLEAAQVTGERISEQEADAAITHYFDNLHTFREPRSGFRLFLARLYIRRKTVLAVVAIAAATLAIVWLWLR